MSGRLLLAFAVAFLTSAAVGLFLIPLLRRISTGQQIREDGPTWHRAKAGTPTMGGIMFITGTAAAIFSIGFPEIAGGDLAHVFIFICALIFGMVGFIDDYEKLRKKRNLGLTAPQKLALQLAVAIAFLFLLRYFGYLTPVLYIPFFNVTLTLPEPVYFSFAAFVMVATVNAVNITDGVDGLATGASLPVSIFYAVVACYWGAKYTAAGMLAAALTGALFGFLLFNFNPAKIFMGDTGSLFLGGALCATAFAFNMPLILLPLCIMFVLETVSDIIQVFYFKATKGKRFFKMAPLHHHLEMGGWSGRKWSEKELFVMYTAVSAIFAVLSFIGVRLRVV